MGLLKNIVDACANQPELCTDPAVAAREEVLIGQAINACGSWGNALREAGLEATFSIFPKAVRLRRARLEVAKSLIEWVRQHGPVSREALNVTDADLLKAIEDQFGEVSKLASELLGLPFVEAADESRCQACGAAIENLSAHLRREHMMSVDEYYERFGGVRPIPQPNHAVTESLMTRDAILGKIRDHARERWPLDRTWVRDNDRELMDAATAVFGSWANALEATDLDSAPIQQKTDEDVLNDVREYVQQIDEDCYALELCLSVVGEKNGALVTTATERFGSWFKALDAIGIDSSLIRRRQRWTRSSTVACLKAWVKMNGALSHAGLLADDPSLFHAVCRYLQGIAPAAEELGLPLERQVLSWDPETVAVELRHWCDKHGVLSSADLQKTDRKLYDAVKKHFDGGVKEAAEALDLPLELDHDQGKWTPEHVCEELRRLHEEGVVLTVKNVGSRSWGLANAAQRRFSTWENALIAAGLSGANKPQSIARDPKQIKDEIIAWMNEHGDLNATRLKQTNPGLHGRVTRKYGTFRLAAKALNIPYRYNEKKWNREKIIAALKEHHAAGKKMTIAALKAEPGGTGLYKGCCDVFGGVEAARRAAGLRKSPRKSAWTKRAVLAELRSRHENGESVSREALQDGPSGLLSACVRLFDGVQNARVAAGLQTVYETKEDVTTALRELEEQGVRLTGEVLKKEHTTLLNSCRKLFGDLTTARDAAGITGYQRRWTKESVVTELKRLDAEGVLDKPKLNKTHRPVAAAAVRFFGSINHACAAAGID